MKPHKDETQISHAQWFTNTATKMKISLAGRRPVHKQEKLSVNVNH